MTAPTPRSLKPIPKVSGGALGGAIATIIVWLVDELTALDVPTLVSAAVGVIATAGVAYLIPGSDTPTDQ